MFLFALPPGTSNLVEVLCELLLGVQVLLLPLAEEVTTEICSLTIVTRTGPA
jgi:hypothetical protein